MPTEVHVLMVKLFKTSRFNKEDFELLKYLLKKEGYLIELEGPFLKEG